MTEEELKERWTRAEGRKRLAAVIRGLRNSPNDWFNVIDGWPESRSIFGKIDLRDLRGAPLRSLRLHKPASMADARLDGVDLSRARLAGSNFHGANLTGACLQEASLENAQFGGATLVQANLIRTNLAGANLQGADLTDANLNSCTLANALLHNAILRRAELISAKAPRAYFNSADLLDANLSQADLTEAELGHAQLNGTNLSHATLVKADFTRAELRGTNLTNAELSGATLSGADVTGAQLARCEMRHLQFTPDHDAMSDGSDLVTIWWWDRYLSWSKIRKIGQLPLFGVSWGAFLLALAVINGIGALNKQHYIKDFNYPLHIPHRMVLILLATILLVIGSSLYKWACPDRIQEFSETEWVEKHGRPRFQYYGEDWRRPAAATRDSALRRVWSRACTVFVMGETSFGC